MKKVFKSKSIVVDKIVGSESLIIWKYEIETSDNETIILYYNNKLTSFELDNLLELENEIEVEKEGKTLYIKYSS